MERHFFSLRIALLVIVAGILVATVDLAWRGFVVVHDPGDRLVGASLADGEGGARALRQFAPGYWAARPNRDAQLRLNCRSGAKPRRAYATPGQRTTYTVTAEDCRPEERKIQRPPPTSP